MVLEASIVDELFRRDQCATMKFPVGVALVHFDLDKSNYIPSEFKSITSTAIFNWWAPRGLAHYTMDIVKSPLICETYKWNENKNKIETLKNNF